MTSPFHTVAIIPARYRSERLPAKPLADIAGKPMIQHVYERTAQASLVAEVIVATDDERVASAVRAFHGHVVLTPASLASGTDRVAFAAESLHRADIVVNVQGDEPLIEPAMIDEAISPLIKQNDIVAATLVRRIDEETELRNPSIVKVVLDSEGYCMYFSRSMIPFLRDRGVTEWLKHHVYYKHIGLYVFRREFLLRYTRLPQTPLELAEKLEQLRILEHGYRIKGTVTRYDTVPVDTQQDLENVRLILQAHQ
jgi:3-deoxy-manno-octulosonate cytidylyltransferase (CMP-KDO synthetase)